MVFPDILKLLIFPLFAACVIAIPYYEFKLTRYMYKKDPKNRTELWTERFLPSQKYFLFFWNFKDFGDPEILLLKKKKFFWIGVCILCGIIYFS